MRTSKVKQIKELLLTGMPAREIATKLGTSYAYIYQVKNPRNRKKVLVAQKTTTAKPTNLGLIEAVIATGLTSEVKLNIIKSLVN